MPDGLTSASSGDGVAGRTYAKVYEVQGRADLNFFLQEAVAASGGRVLYASDARRAPVYLGIQDKADQRIGLLAYPFRMNRNVTRNRPSDESKGQIRFGGEASWHVEDHPVGRDVAGVDTTLVLGVHPQAGLLVGLDPALYDPLPMGISFYAKDGDLDAASRSGWHVWERVNRPGSQRESPRAAGGIETMIAFTQDRLLDYVRFEQKARDLGLDQPLRFSAAQAFATPGVDERGLGPLHRLEEEFALSSAEILEIISSRSRLAVAVRGGVAEHHLEQILRADPAVARVTRLDADGQHDFDVVLRDGRAIRVECKNASPERYADGAFRVEVQKTRASKGDPASRFYRVDQFDVVAAGLYAPTRKWDFRFRLASQLAAHAEYPGRIKPMQRVDEAWTTALAEAG